MGWLLFGMKVFHRASLATTLNKFRDRFTQAPLLDWLKPICKSLPVPLNTLIVYLLSGLGKCWLSHLLCGVLAKILDGIQTLFARD